MEKPRSFKDFQRDAEVTSNKLLEDLDPHRVQEKKQAFLDLAESVKYIKDNFGPVGTKFGPTYRTFGKKTLTEEQVEYIRANYCTVGMTELCKQMGLTASCVYNCAKGITFRRLNNKYRPVH